MNRVLTFVMYYSLFGKQLYEDDIEIIKSCPKETFGVFSIIRRANKLKSYPIDIHGCIGYWNENFDTLSPETLYNNLLRVSYDSMW